MAALATSSLLPLLDLLSLKDGDGSGSVGSIVGNCEAEPSLIPLLCLKLGESVSATDKGTETAAANALKTFEALANRCIVLSEPHIAAQLPVILLAAAHKQALVRSAAEAAVLAFAGLVFPLSCLNGCFIYCPLSFVFLS